MSREPRPIVLDTSVGVKWIKPEGGREAALALLHAHRAGEVRIIVAAHFVTELVAVAVRRGGARSGRAVWEALRLADLTVIGLDDRIASEAFQHCEGLGCSFYDALPAAIASLAGTVLYSSDARAHTAFPDVVIV